MSARGPTSPVSRPIPVELTEEECLAWLWRMRFSPDGLRAQCPRCACLRRHHRASRRRSWQCQTCGNHIHPTAGTIFHRSRTPLTLWFRTIALVETGDGDLTARQLARELGVSYKTAWRMLKTVRAALEPAEHGGGAVPRVRVVLSGEDTAVAAVPVDRRRRSIRAAALRSRLGSGRLDPREDTHRRILAGAGRAMARRGFVATRIEDISREAAVSAPTIYRYFEKKEDVLMAAVDWIDQAGTARREALLNADADPATKLALFLEEIVPKMDDVSETYALYLDLWARAARDAALRPMVERAEERWHAYFRRLIAEGVTRGQFRLRRELDDTVEFLVAVSVGLTLPLTLGFPSMPTTRLRRLLLEYTTLELGLRPGLLDQCLARARRVGKVGA
jgi:AcrR family transcriptional regulator/transposase-like protein